MPAKYKPPYVKEDGTFCVITKFETTVDAESLSDKVVQWCAQWLEEFKSWYPSWISDNPNKALEKGQWDFFKIFTGPPYIIKAEDNQLWLRLDGEYSYWWRDWFVLMMSRLHRTFPELGKYSLAWDEFDE